VAGSGAHTTFRGSDRKFAQNSSVASPQARLKLLVTLQSRHERPRVEDPLDERPQAAVVRRGDEIARLLVAQLAERGQVPSDVLFPEVLDDLRRVDEVEGGRACGRRPEQVTDLVDQSGRVAVGLPRERDALCVDVEPAHFGERTQLAGQVGQHAAAAPRIADPGVTRPRQMPLEDIVLAQVPQPLADRPVVGGDVLVIAGNRSGGRAIRNRGRASRRS